MIDNVVEYFIESAKRFPTKPAVVCGEDSISFSDLDLWSNSFAEYLTKNKSTGGVFIPFFMGKSIDSIRCILSVLKSGKAYVPIDVNSPKSRFLSILSACDARCVLVNDASEVIAKEYLVGSGVDIININNIMHSSHQKFEMPQSVSVNLAYVLFTSGSTGVPKGVMISHQAIEDYIEWCVATYELTDKDVISNHAPLYFDNSTFDLYTAFKTGSTLHLVPDQLNSVLPRLVKWLDESNITTFFCVPSVLTMLLKSRRLKPNSFKSLRHIITAGEVLSPQVLREWMLMYPNIQFTNMYGPTEITVDCSYHILKEVPDKMCTSIPIGKARKNMSLFVRQDDGSLSQAIGAKGELLVQGKSVANGYLNNEAQTREVFIQNPSHNLYTDRLYCTGDVVSIDEVGDFHFIGRRDNQIKYLGYRIELGEIESQILTISSVSEAVVVFNRGLDGSDDFIGLMVSFKIKTELGDFQLLLVKMLPSYMVPTVVRIMEAEFPKTPNGKYDRKTILDILCEG